MTKCRTCGHASWFRFCSDPCFLSYVKTRTDVECATCQYDVETGRIGNPLTTQLCDECRAAAENAGWNERWAITSLDDDIGENAISATLAEKETRRGRRPTSVQEQIEVLCLVGKRVERPYFDADGHSRGTRVYYEPYTNAEIAAVVGCHKSTVGRVVGRV